jgi:hypothetical protein
VIRFQNLRIHKLCGIYWTILDNTITSNKIITVMADADIVIGLNYYLPKNEGQLTDNTVITIPLGEASRLCHGPIGIGVPVY